MKKTLLPFFILFFGICKLYAQLPTALTQEIGYNAVTPDVDAINDDATWPDPIPFPYTFQAEMAEATDCSAEVQLAWNELGLFIYVAITDDMQHYLGEGETTYQRDNIEMFFYFGDDYGPEAAVTAVENDELYSQLRFQLTDDYELAHDGRYQGIWGAAPVGKAVDGEAEPVMVVTGSGYDLELILPWALFAMLNDPKDEMQFGFDITVGDADEGDRDFQLSLLHDSKQDLAWNNKAYLNTIELFDHCGCAPDYPDRVENEAISGISISTLVTDGLLYLKGVKTIEMINTIGQVVLTATDVNGSVDVSGLQSGVYFVKVNNSKTVKVVIR